MDVTIITTAVTAVATLAGVFLGGWVSRRNSDSQWQRDQQLKSYTEIIHRLIAINEQFATEQRVSKFGGLTAREHGHDFEGATWRWLDGLGELDHLETVLELVGGHARETYRAELGPLLADYMEAIDDATTTEDDWHRLMTRGGSALSSFSAACRADLNVR